MGVRVRLPLQDHVQHVSTLIKTLTFSLDLLPQHNSEKDFAHFPLPTMKQASHTSSKSKLPVACDDNDGASVASEGSSDDGLSFYSGEDGVETTRSFEQRFVHRDTQKVYVWMAAVLGMLSITAALVITLTYKFLTGV